MKSEMKSLFSRAAMTLVLLTAPVIMMWGQEMNKKFSMTTHMFIDELQELKEQQASGTHRAPARRLPDGSELPQPRRLIASPDTIGGVAYISCFIHLSDPSDLSAVRDLGVRVQSTFDGLDFITASVPVDQLNALADVDNVTTIEVSQLMRPTTDVARQKTNVDDLLTQSANAAALGVNSKYDGTGVVLGIVDTGIDFQHIAFKDKDGNSRIKRAYVYNGSGSGVEYTTPETIAALTTDDVTMDHGTHTASTAGGSSVIVNKIADDNFTITVTDEHANATYGGMAPGAELYLAGVKDLPDAKLIEAIQKIVDYADAQGKPVVISNSWGSSWGPHKGTGTFAEFISRNFGDEHPGHIILFSSANNAGRGTAEGGGFFIKNTATQASPLGTILRTRSDGGNTYSWNLSIAYADQPINCALYVLDNSTGAVLMSRTFTANTDLTDISVTEAETTTTYYTGTLKVKFGTDGGDNYVYLASDETGLKIKENNAYTLALRVYPADANATANINMWAGDSDYFAANLTTTGITWTAGTDDMSVSEETTMSDAISVGAYVSKTNWTNYAGEDHSYSRSYLDDIAYFSSYATANMSPTGLAYPWITAPGSALVAGVNHFHTTEVDDDSYFGTKEKNELVVNNAVNPYGVMRGTSMATPVAAGIVALWLQAAKTLTVNQVKEIMRTSAINDEYTTTGANASHFGQGKIDALAGIYAIKGGLSLAENNYNQKNIDAANDKTYNVTLTGRTLYKDGYWNTLCLPFDVDLTAVGCPLAGATARTLNSASITTGETGSTLTLTFDNPVTKLVAGTPYIIKWTKAEGYDLASEDTRDIKNPVFTGVTIDKTDRSYDNHASGDARVRFLGTYAAKSFTDVDKSILFLGVDNTKKKNTLYYPKSGAGIKAQRAYFKIGDDNSSAPQLTAINLNFDGETTGVTPLLSPEGEEGASPWGGLVGVWYTLSGTRLSTKPTQKGVYIHNGKKVVIK
jgi:hypothetical protein